MARRTRRTWRLGIGETSTSENDPAVQGPKVRVTLRWRGVDSNFRYADVVHLIVAPLRIPRALHRAKKGAPRCGA
jgi:hypothetical protein